MSHKPMIRCGCCGGSGKYNPLMGPPENCKTCKGEGVVPEPSDVVPPALPTMAPAGEVPGMQRYVAHDNLITVPADTHISDMEKAVYGFAFDEPEPSPTWAAIREKILRESINATLAGYAQADIERTKRVSEMMAERDAAPTPEARNEIKGRQFAELYGGKLTGVLTDYKPNYQQIERRVWRARQAMTDFNISVQVARNKTAAFAQVLTTFKEMCRLAGIEVDVTETPHRDVYYQPYFMVNTPTMGPEEEARLKDLVERKREFFNANLGDIWKSPPRGEKANLVTVDEIAPPELGPHFEKD